MKLADVKLPPWFRQVMLDLAGVAPEKFQRLSDKTFHAEYPPASKFGLSVVLGTKGSRDVAHVIVTGDEETAKSRFNKAKNALHEKGWKFDMLKVDANEYHLTVYAN